MRWDRRSVLVSGFALAACQRGAQASAPATTTIQPLKSVAPFPVGVAAMSGQLLYPAWVDLATRHFSQLTPEWEMKMERVLTPDGRFDFTAADAIAGFAREHALRLHATTLIWYAQDHPYFKTLPESRFAAEYDRWITTMIGRYRGRASGWDTVNEPVAEDGDGLRDCLWSQRLGQDGYMIRAFEGAHAADPEAVLFLNDYNLENLPAKGATFLKLVERLLSKGAPIGGLGTQSHLDIEIPQGQITAFMRELAQFGLPIHVSELDATLNRDGGRDTRSITEKRNQQIARVTELAEAFVDLPPAQRYAFTVWGLKDTDSWLRREATARSGDEPVLFDANGQPKALAGAVEAAFRGG